MNYSRSFLFLLCNCKNVIQVLTLHVQHFSCIFDHISQKSHLEHPSPLKTVDLNLCGKSLRRNTVAFAKYTEMSTTWPTALELVTSRKFNLISWWTVSSWDPNKFTWSCEEQTFADYFGFDLLNSGTNKPGFQDKAPRKTTSLGTLVLPCSTCLYALTDLIPVSNTFLLTRITVPKIPATCIWHAVVDPTLGRMLGLTNYNHLRLVLSGNRPAYPGSDRAGRSVSRYAQTCPTPETPSSSSGTTHQLYDAVFATHKNLFLPQGEFEKCLSK